MRPRKGSGGWTIKCTRSRRFNIRSSVDSIYLRASQAHTCCVPGCLLDTQARAYLCMLHCTWPKVCGRKSRYQGSKLQSHSRLKCLCMHHRNEFYTDKRSPLSELNVFCISLWFIHPWQASKGKQSNPGACWPYICLYVPEVPIVQHNSSWRKRSTSKSKWINNKRSPSLWLSCIIITSSHRGRHLFLW